MLLKFLGARGTKKRELCCRLTFDIEQLFAMRITRSPEKQKRATYKCVRFNNNRERALLYTGSSCWRNLNAAPKSLSLKAHISCFTYNEI